MSSSESEDNHNIFNDEWEESLMNDLMEKEEISNSHSEQKNLEYISDDEGYDFHHYSNDAIINSIIENDILYGSSINDDDIKIIDVNGSNNMKFKRSNPSKKRDHKFDKVKKLVLKEEEREKRIRLLKKKRYLESINKKLAPLIKNILYVTKIPYGTTKQELIKAFSQCTKIVDAGIAINKHSGFQLGFGFIKVENEEDKRKLLNWEYMPRFRDQYSGKMKAVELKVANERNTERFRKLVNCNDKSLNLLSLELDYEFQYKINAKR